MTAATLETYPSITVTKAGVPVRLPMQLVPQRGGAGGADLRPVAVARNPKIAFPPPLAIGEGSVRRNYDIDEVIFTTWQQGMGEDAYAAATPPNGYQSGRLDTRWPNVLVARPLASTVGAAQTFTLPMHRVVELNYTNATLLWYQKGNNAYRYTGAAWTNIQSAATSIGLVWQHALGLNGVAVSGSISPGVIKVFRSADGVTWDAMALGAMTAPTCICAFDNRMFAIDQVSSGAGSAARYTYTAYASADFWSAAVGAGTWTAGAQIVTPNSEVALKAFVWVYPPDKGRTTLWMLTNARLWYYDYYAATPAWVEWYTFRSPQQANSATSADCVVGPKNNNLYVAIYGQEWIWEFTGATISRLSWNNRHGMPAGTRLSPYILDADGTGVYVFCGPHPADSSAKGAALFMAEGGNFHHLYDSTTRTIYGGGIGAQNVWPVDSNGSDAQVYQLANPDTLTVPPLVAGRTYDATIQYLTTGWINAGLVNVNKRVLYVEVDGLKADGTPGLDSGAQVSIGYEGRRSGVAAATTLTSANTWPAVIDFAGANSDKEFRLIVGLKRGTATSATPIVRAIKVGYRPRPKQRHTYTVRVDLRDECEAFAESGKFHGYAANYLRQWLDELADNDDAGLDDPLVGLSYGGYGNLTHPRYRSIPQCEVLVQAQESPDRADGLYLLSFNDVSAPTSG